MPISSYFNGNGTKVADSMKKTYADEGPDAWKRVFYATANSRKKRKGAEPTDRAAVLKSMQKR